jgi:hypothetical protein
MTILSATALGTVRVVVLGATAAILLAPLFYPHVVRFACGECFRPEVVTNWILGGVGAVFLGSYAIVMRKHVLRLRSSLLLLVASVVLHALFVSVRRSQVTTQSGGRRSADAQPFGDGFQLVGMRSAILLTG